MAQQHGLEGGAAAPNGCSSYYRQFNERGQGVIHIFLKWLC